MQQDKVRNLIEYNKKFLIIGNQNAVTCKEIFPLIKNNKIWLGYNVGAFRFVFGRVDKGGARMFDYSTINKREVIDHLATMYTKKDLMKGVYEDMVQRENQNIRGWAKDMDFIDLACSGSREAKEKIKEEIKQNIKDTQAMINYLESLVVFIDENYDSEGRFIGGNEVVTRSE